MAADPRDQTDDTSAVPLLPPDRSEEERVMREAEARALAESGLGSGLLARQPTPADQDTVAVLKVCPLCGTEYETAARFCPSDGAALRPKGSDSLVGRVLADRYHILKRIGEGGMGRVYLGEHVKMNRQCAIKVMSPVLVNDAESAARFGREASNAARIIHPNVAAVFDYGESDGLVYLVMEFVDGEPLSRLLAREAPLSNERAFELTRQIADGLGAAHELGIVHRDLKPDNILITRTRAGREIAKVVDFGIAKAIQEGAGDGLTRTGQVIGTPEFMSPEQLVGDPVDARSDLYALGCIFHLMLTASPPFNESTREQMIKRRLSEDAPPVRALDPEIPESVAGIVARLLARSPKNRYASAAEVRDALAGTHRRSGRAPKAADDLRVTPRSAPTVAFLRVTQATTEVTEIPVAKPARRLPIIIGAVAIVAAVGVAAIIRDRPSAVATEQPASAVPDSVVATDVAPLNTPVTPGSDPVHTVLAPPVQMVDTVQRNARLAEKARRDSIARVAEAEVNAVRAPIVRYSKAIESGSINSLRAALPGLTPQQELYWEKNVFARAEKVDASLRWAATKVSNDSANADFSVNLKFVLKDTKQPMTTTLNQHATLAKRANGWQLLAVTYR